MLIGLALGAIVALLAVSALRFFRMDDTVEQARSAKTQRKQVVFEGRLTPRSAREEVAEALVAGYAGEQIRIVVERTTTEQR